MTDIYLAESYAESGCLDIQHQAGHMAELLLAMYLQLSLKVKITDWVESSIDMVKRNRLSLGVCYKFTVRLPWFQMLFQMPGCYYNCLSFSRELDINITHPTISQPFAFLPFTLFHKWFYGLYN